MNAFDPAHRAALAQVPEPPLSSSPIVSWQALRTMPLVAHMEDAQLAALAQQFQWRMLEEGETLPQALCGGRFNLLVSGRLWVRYVAPSGRELLVGDMLAGQSCGNTWSTEQPPLLLEVSAAEPSLIASLDAQEAQALIQQEPLMLRAMMQGMNHLIWVLVTRLVDMGTLSVRSRLHARLLSQAERAGITDNQALITPAPTQVSLAALVGTSREEVTREMSRLKRLGLLQREGRGLRLNNVDGLRVLLEDMR